MGVTSANYGPCYGLACAKTRFPCRYFARSRRNYSDIPSCSDYTLTVVLFARPHEKSYFLHYRVVMITSRGILQELISDPSILPWGKNAVSTTRDPVTRVIDTDNQ